MIQPRSAAARRSVLTAALLATSALAAVAPAHAQIETVVVTAEKRQADMQSVPIAVTAYTAQDLKNHQIDQFKDLVFSTPNVSYSKGNFTGSDFQIRGIGVAAVSGDAESGVAVHQDDVYLANPPLAEATFYDLERIEVLRGPQSTLYGRGATGGTVNIITAKPDFAAYSANFDASYGNYNASEIKGMVNMPFTDTLGVRIAGDWVRHDGYVTNLADNSHIDSQDTYSVRGTIRWQPTAATTIDLIGSFGHEGDSRMRSQKQLCAYDPTGVLGCLPDQLGHDGINNNSTLTTVFSSQQAFALAGLPSTLGLFDLTQQAPLNVNPADARQVITDFAPDYKAEDRYAALNVKQRLTDWLDLTGVFGYDSSYNISHESYNNSVNAPLDPVKLATAEGTFLGALSALGGPAYAANYAPFFTTVPGSLPVSSTTGLGLTSGNIAYYSPDASGYDQSNGQAKQYSAELRVASSFDGPLNFLLAGYYLATESAADYYVAASTFDYPSIIYGGFEGLGQPACASGCILAPGFYRNQGTDIKLRSKAVFGEVYYDAIPGTLKFTGGLRFTEDTKSQLTRIQLLTGVLPLGTQSVPTAVLPYTFDQATFDRVTGRVVADWTPKLDFTDQTLVYASYARGYKAGGFNPGIQPGLPVKESYAPEGIDSLELGTKNTLLDGMLQANFTAWYYNYENLQVSSIINNTSVNQNIGARLWGVEGEFIYQPSDNWQFNLNFGHTSSSIGNVALVDPRNPTGGRSDVVLVKDATPTGTAAENCVYYMLAPGTPTPAELGVPGFFAPPGGVSALAANGVAHANYGVCGLTDAQAHAFGYTTVDPQSKSLSDASGGVPVNLHGNELQNTPPWTISIGAQYMFHLPDNYTLTPRVDVYWQDNMYGRIFNDAPDHINAWEVTNAQVTFTAPDAKWYAQAFIKNVFDENNVTGQYLTSATSGLYTNEFLGDPRTYGLRVGVNF